MVKNVLITRPIDDAQSLAQELVQLGYQTSIQPLLTIKPVAFIPPELNLYDAIIFTSSNAVAPFITQYDIIDLPVYVVGDKTEKTSIEQGLKNISNAHGTVEDLEDLMNAQDQHTSFLYVRGNEITRSLKSEHKIDEIITYKSIECLEISPDIIDQIKNGEFSHILFFSRRTAQAFNKMITCDELLKTGLKHTKALCLGDSMLEFLDHLPWESIHVVDTPNKQEMIALLNET